MAWHSPVSGTLAATGGGTALTLHAGLYNLTVSGTFVGTWTLQRSNDGGSTWADVTDYTGVVVGSTTTMNTVLIDAEDNIKVRVNCSAYTSGTISYRLAQ